MAFMLGYNLVFIDSLQFMNQSLANLVKNLPEDAYKYTNEVFKGEKLQLMKQKGVYPYDYMSNFDKFNDTQLPTKDEFYSQMNNTHITDEEYTHAQNVWNTFNLKKTVDAENKTGYLLEVDLEYPHELHDLHNDYPCGAEQIKVTQDMLSDYCQRIAEKFGIKSGQVSKLILTLGNKTKYVLHYRNLQLYRELGLKLTKIHRVLSFDQSPWLKTYIDFNTRQRTNAKNAFEKVIFKLMNNSVFGKTMENIRKREDIKLVTNEKQLSKLTSKPTFINSKIFNENLVAVHKIKESLTLNRPAYVGMCILDLSKTLMYDFHYNFIKKKYGSKAKLLFTDTDSLTYEIEAEDVYADFWNHKDMFDNSDYSSDNQYFDATNKKVIGKFKDEAAGVPIVEFVGLRSKMYSYSKENNNGGKTAKGIKKIESKMI